MCFIAFTHWSIVIPCFISPVTTITQYKTHVIAKAKRFPFMNYKLETWFNRFLFSQCICLYGTSRHHPKSALKPLTNYIQHDSTIPMQYYSIFASTSPVSTVTQYEIQVAHDPTAFRMVHSLVWTSTMEVYKLLSSGNHKAKNLFWNLFIIYRLLLNICMDIVPFPCKICGYNLYKKSHSPYQRARFIKCCVNKCCKEILDLTHHSFLQPTYNCIHSYNNSLVAPTKVPWFSKTKSITFNLW